MTDLAIHKCLVKNVIKKFRKYKRTPFIKNVPCKYLEVCSDNKSYAKGGSQ